MHESSSRFPLFQSPGLAKPAQPEEGEEQHWDCVFSDVVRFGRNEQGQQTVNDYVLLHELGRGAYGKVQLCERRIGDGVKTPWRRFAMKIMSKPRLRRLSEYVNVPSGGMRKVTAEDKVRCHVRTRELIVSVYFCSRSVIYARKAFFPVTLRTKRDSCSSTL